MCEMLVALAKHHSAVYMCIHMLDYFNYREFHCMYDQRIMNSMFIFM